MKPPKEAAPYDKIVGELPEMLTTVHIAREAMRQRIPAYVLVNNRTEGNAPLTIQALVDMLQTDRLEGQTQVK